MTAFLISTSGATRFDRSDLADRFAENWLQDLLFREPDLLPLDQLDASAGHCIPICRELALPRQGGNVYLDIFGVTPAGRPVLIECKLWRNPQARREVIAQILEYAAILRRWSYADLTAKLKAKLGWSGPNPLYELASANGSSLPEAAFTDAVARNLRNGDFHLVIAGDGIREDATAIAEHIGDRGARIALVEFQRWQDANGNLLIVPLVPFRTDVVRQRIVVDLDGAHLRIGAEDDDDAPDATEAINPERASITEANRAFWQSFIERARFDHPDQPRPRHGGNNWVKIGLPKPARWLNAYRYKGRAGLSLLEAPGSGLIDRLVAEAGALQADFGEEPIRLHQIGDACVPAIAVDEPAGNADQLSWLLDASNRLVSALRPRLSEDG